MLVMLVELVMSMVEDPIMNRIIQVVEQLGDAEAFSSIVINLQTSFLIMIMVKFNKIFLKISEGKCTKVLHLTFYNLRKNIQFGCLLRILFFMPHISKNESHRLVHLKAIINMKRMPQKILSQNDAFHFLLCGFISFYPSYSDLCKLS